MFNKDKKKTEEEKLEETKIVSLVNTFKDKKGKELVKEEAKWISMGAFMGVSDAVPGYSGGTTLALLGFFERLIIIAKSVFVPEKGLTRWKAFLFMMPFAIGWVTGVFGFAKLTELMAEHNMSLELIFFFGFFVAFCIPIFIKSEKPGLIDLKKKKINKSKRWIWFFIGFTIILSVSLYIFFGTKGIDMVKHKASNVYDLSGTGWLKLIGASYLAGLVTLIPGGSGAIIQLITGMYKNIHWKIMAHATDNMGALVLFSLFNFIGMVTMVFILSWGLKKHHKSLASLSFGMLIASIIAIFIVPSNAVWVELKDWRHIIGVISASVISITLAIALNIHVSKSIKKRDKKINEMIST